LQQARAHSLQSFSSVLTPPRPPRATLFPYTTLFRSLPEEERAAAGLAVQELGQRQRLLARAGQRLGQQLQKRAQRQRAEREVDRDRKSTRLNSSHDQISYAVFCLKKKKQYLRKSCAR